MGIIYYMDEPLHARLPHRQLRRPYPRPSRHIPHTGTAVPDNLTDTLPQSEPERHPTLVLDRMAQLAHGQGSPSTTEWMAKHVAMAKIAKKEDNDQRVTTATLAGTTIANCEGKYVKSDTIINGKHVWDRRSGGRFIFRKGDEWAIADSKYREGFIGGNEYICSVSDAEHWWQADWDGAEASASA